MTEEQIKSLQATGCEQLSRAEKNILDNNLSRLWETVKGFKAQGGGRIDFVLDNAGFELYCDFVYGENENLYRGHQVAVLAADVHVADFLIQSGLAKEIRFHGKKYPWFVSDVTRKDWNWLLNAMVYGHLFHTAGDRELRSLKKLGLRWKVGLSDLLSERKS